MSAVVLEDFYKPFFKKNLSETQTNWLLRSVVILLGVLCLGKKWYKCRLPYGIFRLKVEFGFWRP